MILGYPQRCIRSRDFLYIFNFNPERWPAGAPELLIAPVFSVADNQVTGRAGPEHGAYLDIDRSPSFDFLRANRSHPENGHFFELAVRLRPESELYNVKEDPSCLHYLAGRGEFKAAREKLHGQLFAYLRETGDPRVTMADGDLLWESYPKLQGAIRWFPAPAGVGEDNKDPENWPAWLKYHRPE